MNFLTSSFRTPTSPAIPLGVRCRTGPPSRSAHELPREAGPRGMSDGPSGYDRAEARLGFPLLPNREPGPVEEVPDGRPVVLKADLCSYRLAAGDLDGLSAGDQYELQIYSAERLP